MNKIATNGDSAPDPSSGPGPELMGADTLNGNDVYNQKDEDLGDIKESWETAFMPSMAHNPTPPIGFNFCPALIRVVIIGPG